MTLLTVEDDFHKIDFTLRNRGFVLGVARTAIPLRTASDFEIEESYLFIEKFSEKLGLLD